MALDYLDGSGAFRWVEAFSCHTKHQLLSMNCISNQLLWETGLGCSLLDQVSLSHIPTPKTFSAKLITERL